jgi:hypothetical protein
MKFSVLKWIKRGVFYLGILAVVIGFTDVGNVLEQYTGVPLKAGARIGIAKAIQGTAAAWDATKEKVTNLMWQDIFIMLAGAMVAGSMRRAGNWWTQFHNMHPLRWDHALRDAKANIKDRELTKRQVRLVGRALQHQAKKISR